MDWRVAVKKEIDKFLTWMVGRTEGIISLVRNGVSTVCDVQYDRMWFAEKGE